MGDGILAVVEEERRVKRLKTGCSTALYTLV
jgi:hypothetical protein